MVRDLFRGLIAANSTGAVEVPAGLDHKLSYADLAGDFAGGNDFQPFGLDLADKAAADEDALGLDLSFDHTRATNDDLGPGVDDAVQTAVDMQVVF